MATKIMFLILITNMPVGPLDKIFKLTILVNSMHKREIVYLGIISAIFFLGPLATLAYAVTLHEKDYIITNFGIKNAKSVDHCSRVLQEGLMILHWVTKDTKHTFSTLTRALSK